MVVATASRRNELVRRHTTGTIIQVQEDGNIPPTFAVVQTLFTLSSFAGLAIPTGKCNVDHLVYISRMPETRAATDLRVEECFLCLLEDGATVKQYHYHCLHGRATLTIC